MISKPSKFTVEPAGNGVGVKVIVGAGVLDGVNVGVIVGVKVGGDVFVDGSEGEIVGKDSLVALQAVINRMHTRIPPQIHRSINDDFAILDSFLDGAPNGWRYPQVGGTRRN